MNFKKTTLFIMFALMTTFYSISKYNDKATVEKNLKPKNNTEEQHVTHTSKPLSSELVAFNSFENKNEFSSSLKKTSISKRFTRQQYVTSGTPYVAPFVKIKGIQKKSLSANTLEIKTKGINSIHKSITNSPKLSPLARSNNYLSKRKDINITDNIKTLQNALDVLPSDPKKFIHKKHYFKSKTAVNKNMAKYQNKRELEQVRILSPKLQTKLIDNGKYTNKGFVSQVGYWDTVHSIESKQGKLLYRPRNKARNCTYTSGPCGHHQLTVQALKDIGCNGLQCRKDRLNYEKSLQLSKKLLALNEKRLKKHGLTNLQGHERYLIHQQGANGIKNIIAATEGKKQLSATIKKNMANNSPYSYKQLKNMSSKNAANTFMNYWKYKWAKEQRLILATTTKTTNRLIKTRVLPSFNDKEINFALNMSF